MKRAGSDPAGASRLQQGLPDGVSQLLGRRLSVLQVHPDELQRPADHVDVGGDQPLAGPGLTPFGHQHLDQIEDGRWVCFQDLRCSPTVRRRASRWRHQQRRACRGGRVWCGLSWNQLGRLVSYSVDPSPIISGWHSVRVPLLPSQIDLIPEKPSRLGMMGFLTTEPQPRQHYSDVPRFRNTSSCSLEQGVRGKAQLLLVILILTHRRLHLLEWPLFAPRGTACIQAHNAGDNPECRPGRAGWGWGAFSLPDGLNGGCSGRFLSRASSSFKAWLLACRLPLSRRSRSTSCCRA